MELHEQKLSFIGKQIQKAISCNKICENRIHFRVCGGVRGEYGAGMNCATIYTNNDIQLLKSNFHF